MIAAHRRLHNERCWPEEVRFARSIHHDLNLGHRKKRKKPGIVIDQEQQDAWGWSCASEVSNHGALWVRAPARSGVHRTLLFSEISPFELRGETVSVY